MIIIFQEDIFNDSYNWQDDITNYIKHYNKPEIIYLAKNPKLYKLYK